MYSKLLSASVVAGLLGGTCDPGQALYDPPVQGSPFSVAADSDFTFALGGKTAAFYQGMDPPPDPPPDDDEPVEPPDGVGDPGNSY